MNASDIRDYCIGKKAVTESFPFDENVLVFKVCGKIFLLISLAEASTINLKCDPEYAIELREKYTEIVPGFHMNKKHWNTVTIDEGLSKKLILELIDHSYDMVLKGLTKSDKMKIT
jgi:predicted DNA-binding protein (MmcQ/YjbR family)